jgi:hypothetical protein
MESVIHFLQVLKWVTTRQQFRFFAEWTTGPRESWPDNSPTAHLMHFLKEIATPAF